MNSRDNELAIKIQKEIGVARGQPTYAQLEAIKEELAHIVQEGRAPTYKEWREAVWAHCEKGPMLLMEGVDNSDLDALLILALEATPSKRKK